MRGAQDGVCDREAADHQKQRASADREGQDAPHAGLLRRGIRRSCGGRRVGRGAGCGVGCGHAGGGRRRVAHAGTLAMNSHPGARDSRQSIFSKHSEVGSPM